jgi:putative phosphoribosyl transferase
LKPAFRDRPEAGRRLAALLEKYNQTNALVLAIPAGGVPVAVEIAKALQLSLHVTPVSKILFPWTTEGGYGAVAFDGSVWIDQAAVQSYGLTAAQIEKATADAHAKVERRAKRFGSAQALADLSDKPAILVDDGIAAGSTMRTAIAALRKRGVKQIVVAVPTAHQRSVEALRKLVDEIVCVDIRGGPRFAVADAYLEWRDLTDDEIEEILKR